MNPTASTQVSNQLQNVVLMVLTFFATRAHMSSDSVGMLSGIVGMLVTMGFNYITVSSPTIASLLRAGVGIAAGLGGASVAGNASPAQPNGANAAH